MDYPTESIKAVREQLNQKLMASIHYSASTAKAYTAGQHTDDGYAAVLCALEDSMTALNASRSFSRIVGVLDMALAQQASNFANDDGFEAPVPVV